MTAQITVRGFGTHGYEVDAVDRGVDGRVAGSERYYVRVHQARADCYLDESEVEELLGLIERLKEMA